MLKTDNTWKSGIISNGRYFTYRFLANGADAIASKYVTSCMIDECGASEHRLKAGEFCKNSIELTVLTNAYTKWRGGYIQIYVSCNGSAEVPLGKYWIYEQKLQDDGRYTKLTGYDVPEYMTEKADPASTSVAAIISAIESDSGMRVTNKNVFTMKTITAFPEGTTYMQLLGYIAGYDGYNLRTDRNGNIEAYRYTRSADILLVPKEDLFPAEDLFPDHREINASDAFSGYVIPRRNTYIGSQSYAADPISVNSIVVTNGSDTYTVGVGTSISYENPFITSADQIDKTYLGFSYVPIDNSWRGNPAVQIGDVLMVETSEGTFQTVLVMEQKLTLDGGFSATLSCYGETDAALASVESPTMREIKAAKKTLTDALLEALTTILGAGAGYFNFVDKDGNVITSNSQDATIAGWQITDSPTVTDSTKGWRFLLGGLYYSSNGFKTAKNFALTDEGQIVANSITTGTIQDAAGNNYWNLDTGDFRLSALTNLSTKVDTNTSSINSNTESIIANTKDIQANTKDIQSNTKAIQSNAAELSNFITATYKQDITDLQNQIDGNISTWYYTGVPTLTNIPASQWTTQADKDKHIGDLYYDKNTGYVYRFMLDNSVYKWIRITDEDIGAAMSAASKAQDTADGKRRVFVTQPVPPYDKGDLWCTGSSGDILTCMIAKASGGSYAASDWQKLNKYTDDSAVKALDNKLNSSEEIFNRLTNNGTVQGITMQDGNLYINAAYILAGILAGFTLDFNLENKPTRISGGNFSLYDYVDEETKTIYGLSVRAKNDADVNKTALIVNGSYWLHSPDLPAAISTDNDHRLYIAFGGDKRLIENRSTKQDSQNPGLYISNDTEGSCFIDLTDKGWILINADTGMIISTKGNLALSASGGASLSSSGNLNLGSGRDITLNASGKVTIKGSSPVYGPSGQTVKCQYNHSTGCLDFFYNNTYVGSTKK